MDYLIFLRKLLRFYAWMSCKQTAKSLWLIWMRLGLFVIQSHLHFHIRVSHKHDTYQNTFTFLQHTEHQQQQQSGCQLKSIHCQTECMRAPVCLCLCACVYVYSRHSIHSVQIESNKYRFYITESCQQQWKSHKNSNRCVYLLLWTITFLHFQLADVQVDNCAYSIRFNSTENSIGESEIGGPIIRDSQQWNAVAGIQLDRLDRTQFTILCERRGPHPVDRWQWQRRHR